MKKIAILMPAMRIGGAEKVLLEFLKDAVANFDVTLVLNEKSGELLSYIPKNVRVIEHRISSFREILKKDLKSFNIKNVYNDLIYYLRLKLYGNYERNYSYIIKRNSILNEYFDCAISYVANVSTQIFCLTHNLNAKVKIAWIHGETTELKDNELFNYYYQQFTKIFTVSEVTKSHFLDRFPSCKNKVDVYYNAIPKNAIIAKSILENQDKIFDNNYMNILTVGRISPEKGFDMIPEIVKILSQQRYQIRWYIIGDGPYKDTVKNAIIKYGVSAEVFLLGNKLNPYPYMCACDIYVQPSYEEGYSTTICEAGILGKAIIGTITSGGIHEQLENGMNGLIVQPEAKEIANAIKMLLTNPEKKIEFENNIKKVCFEHKNEIIKLKSFLSDNSKE